MTINFFFLYQLFMNYLYRIKIDKKKENKNNRFICFYFIFKIRYSLNKNNNYFIILVAYI